MGGRGGWDPRAEDGAGGFAKSEEGGVGGRLGGGGRGVGGRDDLEGRLDALDDGARDGFALWGQEDEELAVGELGCREGGRGEFRVDCEEDVFDLVRRETRRVSSSARRVAPVNNNSGKGTYLPPERTLGRGIHHNNLATLVRSPVD